MKENPPTAIIFDLDGTLADSIPLVIEIVNELHIIDRKLTRADYERAKNLSIKEILKEFDISLWRAPGLLVKGRAALTHRIDEVPFFAGMDTVVNQLAKDHRLFVMSSNSLENVQRFLEIHGMERPFEAMYGGVGIFGKPKVLRKIVKEHALDETNAYYVGDEVRDIEAAKKAGLKSVAVTWGFNGEKFLLEHQPDHLVHTPQELQHIFRRGKA